MFSRWGRDLRLVQLRTMEPLDAADRISASLRCGRGGTDLPQRLHAHPPAADAVQAVNADRPKPSDLHERVDAPPAADPAFLVPELDSD